MNNCDYFYIPVPEILNEEKLIPPGNLKPEDSDIYKKNIKNYFSLFFNDIKPDAKLPYIQCTIEQTLIGLTINPKIPLKYYKKQTKPLVFFAFPKEELKYGNCILYTPQEQPVPNEISHPCHPGECGGLRPDNRCQQKNPECVIASEAWQSYSPLFTKQTCKKIYHTNYTELKSIPETSDFFKNISQKDSPIFSNLPLIFFKGEIDITGAKLLFC